MTKCSYLHKISSGFDRTSKIELTPAGIVADPITITASKRQEKVLDAPASVTVLSTRDVETKTVLSPADLLRGVPAFVGVPEIGRLGILRLSRTF